jgi:hypothetical protein
MPATPAPFHAFLHRVGSRRRVADGQDVGPAPDRQAPAAPRSYASSISELA